MRPELKILLLIDGLAILAAGLIGPIYAIFVEEIGGDILEASGAYAAFTFSAGVVIYFLGRWEDHLRHDKWFIIAGSFIVMLGFLGYIFVDSPSKLFLVQIILGLGAAVKSPAYDSLYSRFSIKHWALAWGEWEAMDYMVSAVAALCGGLIANYFGFKALLLGMFGFSILSFLTSFYLLKIKKEPAI